ncbi:uncharacterized protein LOC112089159 [Eutrema salsugineum]|uniref:uncharacterized protein LOC112089159 n=1 Tax=Eutrema salsugineum TaxID=72664 RepID=UPI000CED7660|nr:uncharacterized protein LOC112089159 [Eutrema salsugineum]
MALQAHCRRRHRVDILNAIEEVIHVQKQKGILSGDDVFLWRRRNDRFSQRFSSKDTLSLIRTAHPTCDWAKGIWTDSCVFCKAQMETRNHLFFECVFTEKVWSSLTRKLMAPHYTNNWDEIIDQLHHAQREFIMQWLIRYVFQTTLYTIWRERNNRRHGEQANSDKQIIQSVDKQIRNRLTSIRVLGDARYEGGMEKWFSTR